VKQSSAENSVTFAQFENLVLVDFAAMRGLLLSITLAVIVSYASAQSPAPVLVELFTSEGCSSCPPADALLQKLDSTQPVSGAKLIVLSEHVDYWDDLGWKDPNSSHAYTERQQQYVSRLGLATAYTPQIIVDGAIQCVGSDRDRVNKALEKASASTKIEVRITQTRIEGNNIIAHVETGAAPSKSELIVVLALERVQSQVLKGENGGRRLEHVAVVKSLSSVSKIAKGETFVRDVTLPLKSSGGPYRVIAYVQEANQGHVLGAATEHVR
jgi:hypothetical protein